MIVSLASFALETARASLSIVVEYVSTGKTLDQKKDKTSNGLN
jgi:hypothetical protein